VQYLRDAGCGYRLLVPLTSIALAATGGYDDYDVRAATPGAGRWLGLFGVNVDRWPLLDPELVLHPLDAAQHALALSLRRRSFDWSETFVNRQAFLYEPTARAALVGTPHTETQPSPIRVTMHRIYRTNEHALEGTLEHG